ncbi:hypothetical protein Droror1_Dr00002527 [Drosera rotundifolia]
MEEGGSGFGCRGMEFWESRKRKSFLAEPASHRSPSLSPPFYYSPYTRPSFVVVAAHLRRHPSSSSIIPSEDMDGLADKSMQPPAPVLSSNAELEEKERKARVDTVWQSMNKGVSTKTLKFLSSKTASAANGTSKKDKSSQSWMMYLGMAPKKSESQVDNVQEEKNPAVQSGISDEAKKLAAAALTAVKDGAPLVQGKVEITEIRDFAGQDIEVKKLVDPNSKEATEKAKTAAGQSLAVDSILEQIRKKQKLNVLDKTKKDWGEFKQENKGLEDELDAYKKSANQYLDKVSFLERTDYREFERERDARLAVHTKKIPDMREEP